VRQASQPEIFYNRVCQYLVNPITSSPVNGTGLALSILSTVFNTIPPDSEGRFHVLFTILRVIKNAGSFDNLKPYLKNLDSWLAEWDLEEEEERKLFLALSDLAGESGDSESAYQYLLKSLRTYTSEEATTPDARQMSLRALKSALIHANHYDFQDLADLDSIQALRQSDPIYFQLLEIFTSDLLDDFNDFKEEHEGWIEAEDLDKDALNRKMRLLTLASLAAQAGQTRQLPYAQIAKALQIPAEDVEMWVIDVIRAGLVEGKLSQLNQMFLIHRNTYRVFGENQWREVASRLDMWRNSLTGVLEVIRAERASYAAQQEQEARDLETKVTGTGQSAQSGQGYRKGGQRRDQQQAIEING
jgi:translation initiation factor 3 subunit M